MLLLVTGAALKTTDVLDNMNSGDNITGSGNDSTTNGNQPKDPGVDAPTTPVVKPRRNWDYDKYKSSKKYRNISKN